MRMLRLAHALFVTVLKRRLAYRGDLLIQGLDEVLRGLLALAMLQVYTLRTADVAGWSAADMLFILGFSLVPVACFHCLCGNLYQLSGRYILNGNFDRILLRPYPSFLQVCFDRIAIEDLSGAVLGLSIMIAGATQIPGFSFAPQHLLLLVLLQISAFGVVVAVFMAFASSGFWFEDRVGMVPPVYNLMEFGRWPTGIYHWSIQLLITCAVPFAFIAFYPADFILRGVHSATWWTHPGLLTPVIATLALILAAALWRAGVRRYNSAGT